MFGKLNSSASWLGNLCFAAVCFICTCLFVMAFPFVSYANTKSESVDVYDGTNRTYFRQITLGRDDSLEMSISPEDCEISSTY